MKNTKKKKTAESKCRNYRRQIPKMQKTKKPNFAEGKCNNRRLKTWCRKQEEPLQKTNHIAEDKKNHYRRQNSLQNTRRTLAEDKTHCRR